jgi:hypothetical protein
MARALLTAAAIVAVMMALAGVARSANPPKISGADLARLLEKHVIPGTLNLDQKTIDQPFVCHKCTFEGPVNAVAAVAKVR